MSRDHFHTIRTMIEIALIALAGFGAMYGFAYMFGLSDSAWNYGMITLVLILASIAVPYGILKLGMPQTHEQDRREKELRLQNIPKDLPSSVEKENG